uniref:Uncharacterized protein n=1 Tax=Compsopogon caeruleus TaxID=31354 RepID=A0A7S1XE29_9RHOD|mmetsp:Transcript_420/g.733  ORF Transcript_420/g.733 Transcript_420/m.733 type:complete len:339 (+) Transcript_420:592-1608(+)
MATRSAAWVTNAVVLPSRGQRVTNRRTRALGRVSVSACAGSASLSVVVTGSSRGIGLALAREFLRAGDRVVICSRSDEDVRRAVEALRKELEDGSTDSRRGEVYGTTCDVRDAESVAALRQFSEMVLGGRVDVWVNNAGTVAGKRRPLMELDPDDVDEVIRTNLVGTMLCCREAMLGMTAQEPPGGHIFLMDGAGVLGGATPGYAAYGATKRAIPQLRKTLAEEVKGIPIGIHNLSPGMVLTDLLLSDSTKEFRKFFNFLAEEPETVAKDLVPRIRSISGTNAYIRFLTIPRAVLQIFLGFAFGVRRNKFFDWSTGERVDDGNEALYSEKSVRIPFKE